MAFDRQAKISLALSVAAFATSIATLWLGYFRDVSAELVLAPDLFIANAFGGIPNAEIKLSLRGVGPDERALIISRIEATLTRKTTGERISLRSSRRANYPKILKGKEVVAEEVLLVVNDYVSDEAKRFDRWCNDLLGASPDQRDDIEALRKKLAARYLPAARPDPASAMDSEIEDEAAGPTRLMQKIISNIPQERTDRVVFFSGGVYELEVKLLDQNDKDVAVRRATFTIDEFLSRSVRVKLDSRKRVALVPAA